MITKTKKKTVRPPKVKKVKLVKGWAIVDGDRILRISLPTGGSVFAIYTKKPKGPHIVDGARQRKCDVIAVSLFEQ